MRRVWQGAVLAGALASWMAGAQQSQEPQNRRPVLSPELAREQAEREALRPEVAPDLKLPDDDSLLALDTFSNTPELVPLQQQGTDLNKETAHAVLKATINPSSSPHRMVELRGDKAEAQLHVAQPELYVRIGKEARTASGGGFMVDTHGASGRDTPSGSAGSSDYIIERVDVRSDSRVVNSFRIAQLGTGRAQAEVIEVKRDDLPGGHWLRLTPTQPLDPGEYALVEILNDREINLNVWDFGVHPAAQENLEALRPEKKKVPTLERRELQPR